VSDPLVTCVLLTADRPAMTNRSVRCFLSQTYERKALLIFDSGVDGLPPRRGAALVYDEGQSPGESIIYTDAQRFRGSSIGALRNAANELCAGTDIIAHWDSDDWSHPYRLAEQVNLLQASQADAVGYHDMLMWLCSHEVGKAIRCSVCGGTKKPRGRSAPVDTLLCDETCAGWDAEPRVGSLWPNETADQFGYPSPEAHLYRYSPSRDAGRYALGTSLLYWRRAWERHKFIDTREPGCAERGGEDNRWVREVRCVSEQSAEKQSGYEPRMIAEIHGGNSSPSMVPGILVGENYTRVPEWDSYCRDRMKL
jgi:hypothetical protein